MKPVVYVFGVPGDNLIKVGCSLYPQRRETTLRRTERMPEGRLLFEQEHPAVDLRWLERAAHRRLSEFRIYHRQEWFLTSASVAIDAIESAHAERREAYWRLFAPTTLTHTL